MPPAHPRLIATVLLALLLAGCGGGSPSGAISAGTAAPSSAAASPSSDGPCDGHLADATRVTFAAAGTPQSGLLIGSGSTAVVFSNASNHDLCRWLPFARTVADAGFTVLLYDYSQRSREAQESGAVVELRRRGAEAVILVGASVGANSSLHVAASLEPQLAGVVSLSAERGDTVDELTVPVLFMSSESEGYVAPDRTREFYATAPATDKAVEILPGNDHGSDMLQGDAGPTARRLVLDFLQAHSA